MSDDYQPKLAKFKLSRLSSFARPLMSMLIVFDLNTLDDPECESRKPFKYWPEDAPKGEQKPIVMPTKEEKELDTCTYCGSDVLEGDEAEENAQYHSWCFITALQIAERFGEEE